MWGEPTRWRRKRTCWLRIWRNTSSNACRGLSLLSSLAPLRYYEPARRGQKHCRHQTVLFKLKRGLADDFQVRTSVVHQDQSIGIDLRQKAANFLLADGHIAVAEKKIDHAFDFHFEA